MDDQGNWDFSEMESELGFTSQKEYEVTNGNIISITEPAYNYVRQYKYDLDNEVPENIRIMNSIVSANEFWYGKNLLIEHIIKNNTDEAFIIKNEYSFDEHGNIIEIRRFNKSGGEENFRPWNTLNFTYEAI